MSESTVVSGPGSLSRRTDMAALDPNSPPYGEHAEIQALQSAAENPQAQVGAAPGPAAPAAPDFSSLIGLGEPGSPEIPITAGASVGPGPGPSGIGLGLDVASEDAKAIDPGLLSILVHQS